MGSGDGYCKEMEVRLLKQPGAITWDELEHSPDIVRYQILEQDPFFTWKARALVCFKRKPEKRYLSIDNTSKEKLFEELYRVYRGLQTLEESPIPPEYVFMIGFKQRRFGDQALYAYLHKSLNGNT